MSKSAITAAEVDAAAEQVKRYTNALAINTVLLANARQNLAEMGFTLQNGILTAISKAPTPSAELKEGESSKNTQSVPTLTPEQKETLNTVSGG